MLTGITHNSKLELVSNSHAHDRRMIVAHPYAFVTLAGRTQSPVPEKVLASCTEWVAHKIKIASLTSR